jgi:hypothetical protein
MIGAGFRIYRISDPRTYVAHGRLGTRGGAQQRHVGPGARLLERQLVCSGAGVQRRHVGAGASLLDRQPVRSIKSNKQVTLLLNKARIVK